MAWRKYSNHRSIPRHGCTEGLLLIEYFQMFFNRKGPEKGPLVTEDLGYVILSTKDLQKMFFSPGDGLSSTEGLQINFIFRKLKEVHVLCY